MSNNQITINKDDLQHLVIYAQRYTIGRMSMAPWKFKQVMLKNLGNLTDNTINVVMLDIERESNKDALGWECDKMLWLDLLDKLKKEMKKRGKK